VGGLPDSTCRVPQKRPGLMQVAGRFMEAEASHESVTWSRSGWARNFAPLASGRWSLPTC
jgi:hypothetical protein